MKLFTRNLFFTITILFFALKSSAQTADFTISTTSGCSPIDILVTNKSTGTISSYLMETGDSRSFTTTGPTWSWIFTSPGTYTVKLTVTGPGGTKSTKSVAVTVYPSPIVSYSVSPTKACPCDEITFTNTSIANAAGPYTSVWSFGDGATATDNNTKYRYCTPGTYNVALKVTNSAGCYAGRIDTAKILIVEKPEVTFIASKTNLCKVPDTTIFSSFPTKGKAPYTYSWDFGDGVGTSTAANPTYSYGAIGSYTIRLIVTDANGCRDTMERLKYIVVAVMNSDFKAPASVCPGSEKILFESSSTPLPLSISWKWSDGLTGTGLAIQRPFWKGGTYTLTMIDSFGPGCKDTAVKNFIVHPKPHPIFSYGPIYPCPAPATITFTNKSYAADSFLWVFGDGSTSKVKDPVHTYTKDSIFTVFLIAKTSFGCLDTFRVRDTTKDFPSGYPKVRGAFPLPTYDSTNSPIIIRVHRANVNIVTDSAGGCLPFVIHPVATLCGRSKLPADTARRPGSCPTPPPIGYAYPPYWICGFDGHLTDKYADEYADPYIILSKTSCNIDPHPYPIVSYFWDFGDGVTSTLDSPAHTYYTEGFWYVKVRVTTHNGCSYTDSMYVTAGNTPIADFSVSPSDICIHDSVTFTGKGSLGNVYTWNFDDGTYFSSAKPDSIFKHRYDYTDTLYPIFTATRNGCKDTMSLRVIVHPPQVFDDIEYFCKANERKNVKFTDKSKGATSVLWRFGDGFTSTSPTVTHSYAVTGKYTVWHIVYNNIYNCSDSVSIVVDIFDPKPFFSTPDTTICVGEALSFTDSSRSYYNNWKWFTSTFSQEDKSGPFVLDKGYPDTGRYTVTYIARDVHNCWDTFVRKNYVLVAKPQMKLVASPVIACAPATITFNDNSTNTSGVTNISRTWRWGDATSSVGLTPTTATHFYPDPGTYKVKLITTDNVGCKDSVEITVESRKPIALFVSEVDTFTCRYRPVKFYSTSDGISLTYKWDFGDGGTATGANPIHTYSAIGTYDVKLIITDGSGCKDSLIKKAFIKTVKPTASFTMSDSVALCPPLFVTFTNTSSADALRFAWDFDNGSGSVLKNPVAPYIDSGVYIIMLMATDKYGCIDTAYGRARVLGYDGALKYTPLLGCSPLAVTFEADLISASVMIWDFADGNTESAVGKLKTTHIYTTPGAYLPKLILGDGKGCSTSSKGIDTIKVDDIKSVVSSTPKCIGTEIIFNDSSYSFFSMYSSSEWTFDDGSTSTSKNPKRTYSKTGTYPITLISTNTNGCKDTITTTITVSPLPIIKAMDTVICLNDKAELSATGGVSYRWNSSPTLSCTDCNNPITSTTVPAIYIVTGTDQNGCKSKDTLSVGVKTKTILILADNAEVCENTPIELKASGAQKYFWTPAIFLSDPNIANPVATMDSSIVYRVIGIEGTCIPDTAKIKVTVHPLPEVNAGPDQKVLAGTEVHLNGTGKDIKNYKWIPAANLSCDSCQNTIAKPVVTTTYTLKGTSEYGCIDSDDVVITIFCDQSQLFIPNTFTPNGDGQNDYFFPQGRGVSHVKSFIVYNRWGQKVFQRTNMDINAREQGWDGSFNGDALTPDTFVYTLEATCDNGETVFWKGDITLIK